VYKDDGTHFFRLTEEHAMHLFACYVIIVGWWCELKNYN